MEFERQLTEVGGSTMLVIPPDLCRYLDLNPKDVITIQDDDGKHGKFVSFWKKKK